LSHREELINIWNSNLVEQKAEKICRLCQECKISSTAIRKRSKKRKWEDFIMLGPTVERSPDTYHVYSIILYSAILTVW